MLLSDRVAMFTQAVGMTASDWPVSLVLFITFLKPFHSSLRKPETEGIVIELK